MKKETKKAIKNSLKEMLYCAPGSFIGSFSGFELGSRIIPEYFIKYVSDEGGNLVKYVIDKSRETSRIIIERNPSYDALTNGIITAFTIVGLAISNVGLNRLEHYLIRRRNEKIKKKAELYIR